MFTPIHSVYSGYFDQDLVILKKIKNRMSLKQVSWESHNLLEKVPPPPPQLLPYLLWDL